MMLARAQLSGLRLMALAALAASASSCLQLEYTRVVNLLEPARQGVDTLEVGTTSLSDCLARLGAPLGVYELPDGAALSYGWLRSKTWQAELIFPVADSRGRITFTDIDDQIRGVLLFFDAQWTLKEIRRGRLRELTSRIGRRRPQAVSGASGAQRRSAEGDTP